MSQQNTGVGSPDSMVIWAINKERSASRKRLSAAVLFFLLWLVISIVISLYIFRLSIYVYFSAFLRVFPQAPGCLALNLIPCHFCTRQFFKSTLLAYTGDWNTLSLRSLIIMVVSSSMANLLSWACIGEIHLLDEEKCHISLWAVTEAFVKDVCEGKHHVGWFRIHRSKGQALTRTLDLIPIIQFVLTPTLKTPTDN